MQPLSAPKIIEIWERAAGQHPLDRAIAMVDAAVPELGVAGAAALRIGARDAHLLAIRELTFGSKGVATANCPNCSQQLEFDLDMGDLRVLEENTSETFEFESGGFRFTFRLPDSRDLAEVANSGAAEHGRERLLERCVIQPSTKLHDAPERIAHELVERMAEVDPQADIVLRLTCARCNSGFDAPFDIAAFLWAEVENEAKRLLLQVHELALAYGWRESDILAMSPRRRQTYLDMVNA
jgi:hypothetical protein